MSFQAPLFLLALLAVPVLAGLLVLARRRRRRYAVRFPATATLRGIVGTTPAWRRHLPTALFLLALAGLIGALARPERTVADPVERASVMLVMDTSGSMQATDVDPTRLDAARDAALSFVDQVPDELQLGIVTFRAFVDTVEQPSSDHEPTESVLEGLVAEGGTATGDALAAAVEALRRVRGRDGRRAPSAVVLLSDGQTTTGRDPRDVADVARRLRIPVHTVALGTANATIPDPRGFGQLSVPPDPATLREVARITGGRAFATDEAEQLDRVYEGLGSRLGTRERKEQVTAGFAAVGAVLLAAALAFSLRWTGRLP